MKLVRATVGMLQYNRNSAELIERAGRTCYKSEDMITEGSAERFIKMLLKNGHESVIEHASATVKFVCDRGISHEIVRHRIASYSQESTRYCNYGNEEVIFIIPPWVRIAQGNYPIEWDGLYGTSKLASIDSDKGLYNEEDRIWFWSCAVSERDYKRLLKLGWSPQKARGALNHWLKTEVVMTANVREWRHFLKMRMAPAAHPQIRELACKLLFMLQNAMPSLFDDLRIPNDVSIN